MSCAAPASMPSSADEPHRCWCSMPARWAWCCGPCCLCNGGGGGRHVWRAVRAGLARAAGAADGRRLARHAGLADCAPAPQKAVAAPARRASMAGVRWARWRGCMAAAVGSCGCWCQTHLGWPVRSPARCCRRLGGGAGLARAGRAPASATARLAELQSRIRPAFSVQHAQQRHCAGAGRAGQGRSPAGRPERPVSPRADRPGRIGHAGR